MSAFPTFECHLRFAGGGLVGGFDRLSSIWSTDSRGDFLGVLCVVSFIAPSGWGGLLAFFNVGVGVRFVLIFKSDVEHVWRLIDPETLFDIALVHPPSVDLVGFE